MRVEVIVAWPDRYSAVQLELAEGATVAEAVAASGFAGDQALVAQAVHGVIATPA